MEGVSLSILKMGSPSNVQEKGQFVVGFLPAHVAVERILVSVVAHVHSVHDGVLEQNVTERAVEHLILGPRFFSRRFIHDDLQLLFLLHALWLMLLRRRLLERLLQLEGLALAPIFSGQGRTDGRRRWWRGRFLAQVERVQGGSGVEVLHQTHLLRVDPREIVLQGVHLLLWLRLLLLGVDGQMGGQQVLLVVGLGRRPEVALGALENVQWGRLSLLEKHKNMIFRELMKFVWDLRLAI